VEDIRGGGATSLRAIAAEMNARGVGHPPWRLMARLDGDEPAQTAGYLILRASALAHTKCRNEACRDRDQGR
jgi:hypothetical protein